MSGAARSREEDIPQTKRGKLTADEKHVIRGMLARGDRISDVAYWFGVSPSTVHGIKKRGKKLAWTLNDALAELPPCGPYALVQRTALVSMTAERDAATAMVSELEALLLKYRARQASVSI